MNGYSPTPIHPIDVDALTAATQALAVRVHGVNAPGELTEALETASSGAHVIVIAGPDAWDAIDEHLALGIHPVVMVASDNPLVATRTIKAEGTGTCEGSTLTLENAGTLHAAWLTDDHTLATHTGLPVATRIRHGNGTLTLVAGTLPAGASTTSSSQWIAQAGGADIETAQQLAQTAGEHVYPRTDRHPSPLVVPSTTWRLTELPDGITSVNDPALLQAAGHAGRTLPENVYRALIDFADRGSKAGAMLIKNAPMGAVPATPDSPTSSAKNDMTSEYSLLACARMLGQPVGYAPEHGGDLIQNVVPTRAGADRQVSTSSKVELEYHTEAAFHPHRPRYLLLACLRGDTNAATTLCSVWAILGHLSAHERAIARQSRFTTGIDESYTGIASSARSTPRPLLGGTELAPKLWLDNDLMDGIDDEARAVLAKVSMLARTKGTSVTLEAGDILVVDNDTAVHGRSPFAPRYDGTDRWLQRVMVISDHTQVGAALDGRIITTGFVR